MNGLPTQKKKKSKPFYLPTACHPHHHRGQWIHENDPHFLDSQLPDQWSIISNPIPFNFIYLDSAPIQRCRHWLSHRQNFLSSLWYTASGPLQHLTSYFLHKAVFPPTKLTSCISSHMTQLLIYYIPLRAMLREREPLTKENFCLKSPHGRSNSILPFSPS